MTEREHENQVDNEIDVAPPKGRPPEPGEFQEADEAMVNQAMDLLREKWGEERRCPYCGASDWKVGLRLMGLAFLRANSVLPAIQVTCGNCGQFTLLDMETVGLWPSKDDLAENSDEET